MNHLMRCDQYTDSADDYIVPASTKFVCVSKFRGKYVKFVVSQHALYMASPFSFKLSGNSVIPADFP